MPDENSKLVYSTDREIPRKGRSLDENHPTVPVAQQRVVVRLERKGRGGKSVTVIEGLTLPLQERDALLRQLKGRLGTGGTVKDSSLEIQGDHRDAIVAALDQMGYRPKRSGG